MATFQELQQQVQGFVGDKSSDTLPKVKAWINEGQREIRSAYEWGFKRSTVRLNTVALAEITCTATNGSATVTTTGSFTGMEGYKFATDVAEPFFRIDSVAANGLSCTLEAAFTEDSVSAATCVVYKDEYDLGEDVESVEAVNLLKAGHPGLSFAPLLRMEDFGSTPSSTEVPRWFYDVASGGNTVVLGFRPIPDDTYPIDVRYERTCEDMSDDDDEPSLPAEFVPLIVDYAHYRAALYDKNTLNAEFAYRTYLKALGHKIAQVQSRTSADYHFEGFDRGMRDRLGEQPWPTWF